MNCFPCCYFQERPELNVMEVREVSWPWSQVRKKWFLPPQTLAPEFGWYHQLRRNTRGTSMTEGGRLEKGDPWRRGTLRRKMCEYSQDLLHWNTLSCEIIIHEYFSPKKKKSKIKSDLTAPDQASKLSFQGPVTEVTL